jgi:hypothetical protein
VNGREDDEGNPTNIVRRPDEEFGDYVRRLERARLEAIAKHRAMEAEALEKVATAEEDPNLSIEARAKRAYAAEFFKAIEEMEDGAKS